MNSLDILLKDLFEYKGYEFSSQNFHSYLRFLHFDETRVMFMAPNNELYVDNTLRLIHKEEQYAKINEQLSKDYHHETKIYPSYMKTEYTGDTIEFLTKSKIPMSRLSNEYDTIFDAPMSYLGILDETHDHIFLSISYLISHGLIKDSPIEKPTNKIREFLQNELIKI